MKEFVKTFIKSSIDEINIHYGNDLVNLVTPNYRETLKKRFTEEGL